MTATIIPFPPDPHSLGATAASAAYQEGQRVAPKAAGLSEVSPAVDRGRFNAGFCIPFNAPHAATNSNRHDLLPVTVKPGEASSPSPSAPIPNPERGCTTGASAIFPNLVSSGLRQPATEVGRSPTDRLNRDIDGLASFSPWTVSRDHWWRA